MIDPYDSVMYENVRGFENAMKEKTIDTFDEDEDDFEDEDLNTDDDEEGDDARDF